MTSIDRRTWPSPRFRTDEQLVMSFSLDTDEDKLVQVGGRTVQLD